MAWRYDRTLCFLVTRTCRGILDDQGRLLPDVLAARRRGIWFDFGNGRVGHVTWDVAERAMQQGFAPDTISTDWTPQGRAEGVIDLPNGKSKFLLLGMPLERVIACATVNAARVFEAFNDRGTLNVGPQPTWQCSSCGTGRSVVYLQRAKNAPSLKNQR
jgi:predicted amidohydrolase